MKIVTQEAQKSCKVVFNNKENGINSIEIEDISGNTHIFSGISLSGDLVIPAPYGCSFTVEDIKNLQLDTAKYEITFASSYSREGSFYASEYSKKYI